MWGMSVFLGVSHTPVLRGRGPNAPKKFGPISYTQTVLTYSEKSWYGNTRGVYSGMFLRVNHAPVPRGWGSSIPHIFGTSYMRAHSTRNNNQIVHGDQTRCAGKFLHGLPRILTGDLSALDNFLIYISLTVILAFVQIGLTHAVNVRQSLKLICGILMLIL